MEISSVTLRVLLLFFPGVLCALLVDALTAHRERTPVQFLTHAFALGMGSYLSLALVRDMAAAVAKWLRLREPLDVTFFEALLNDHTRIAWREIALAGCVGLVLSAAIAAVLNHNLIFRGANRLGVSRKTGDMDVWALLFGSKRGEMVVVRDLARDVAYHGSVEAFSDSSEPAELLLRNVTVYRQSTATKLYELERVYLARKVNELVIEPVEACHLSRS